MFTLRAKVNAEPAKKERWTPAYAASLPLGHGVEEDCVLVVQDVIITVTGQSLEPARAVGTLCFTSKGEGGWAYISQDKNTWIARRLSREEHLVIHPGVAYAFVPEPGRVVHLAGVEMRLERKAHCCIPPADP